MNIILTTPAEVRTLAENYTPESLPPLAILWDWVKLTGYPISVLQLDAALATGQPFKFGDGMISWNEKG